MPQTATAKKEDVRAAPKPERTVPEIDPAMVKLNATGHVFQGYFVRLPEGLIAGDLGDPAIWRRVQKSRCTLRQFDVLTLVAFDQSWIAEAIVASADQKKAVLAKPRITSLPERYDALFQDENYRVIWTGAGYAVERKSDGARVTDSVATAKLAERDLANQYPRRV